MNVLYWVHHPNALSESYIRTEIEWMQRHGVTVSMVAREEVREGRGPCPVSQLHFGSVADAVAKFQPDILNMYWVPPFLPLAELVAVERLPPVTCHCHENAGIQQIAGMDAVRQIWTRSLQGVEAHPKIKFVPACYDPTVFYPRERESYVVNAAAGLVNKGLRDFTEIAARLPATHFVLIARRISPHVDSLSGPNLDLRVNVQHADVAAAMGHAFAYLRGRSEAFLMPVSIAEALGCGLPVVLPDLPAARAYAKEAGYYYQSQEEAADTIKGLTALNDDEFANARSRSIETAKAYTTDVVLPQILEDWKRV